MHERDDECRPARDVVDLDRVDPAVRKVPDRIVVPGDQQADQDVRREEADGDQPRVVREIDGIQASFSMFTGVCRALRALPDVRPSRGER